MRNGYEVCVIQNWYQIKVRIQSEKVIFHSNTIFYPIISDGTLRLCPHWNSLHKILGDRSDRIIPSITVHVENGGLSAILPPPVDAVTINHHTAIKEEEMDDQIVLYAEPEVNSQSPAASPNNNNDADATSINDSIYMHPHSNGFVDLQPTSVNPTNQSNSEIDDSEALGYSNHDGQRMETMSLAEQELEFKREKLVAEIGMQREVINVKREALQLKRERFQRRMEFKQAKMRAEENLRILEIEKEERLARLELELKYKAKESNSHSGFFTLPQSNQTQGFANTP